MRSWLLAVLAVVPSAVHAQADGDPSGLQWGGYVKTDHRVGTGGGHELTWNELRVRLTGDAATGNARFHGDVWVRSLGVSNPSTLEGLSSSTSLSPVRVDVREAFVQITDFVADGLDLRAGRQRISWGRADRLNPTDNLNPYDLEDLWDFGRHLGSDALAATYYGSWWNLSVVAIPSYTPALLPAGDLSAALMTGVLPSFPAVVFPTGTSMVVDVELPSRALKDQITAGMRLSAHTAGVDWSLSYVYGREHLPVPRWTVLRLLPTGGLEIHSRVGFPRTRILGFDAAGAIGDVGVWAEGAVFFHERTFHTMADFPWSSVAMLPPVLALNDKPYMKWVVGADYTFPGDVYVNVQFLHGFVHERDPAALHDYLVFRCEWKPEGGKLTITPLGGALEAADFHALKKQSAVVYAPEIVYRPYDNIDCTIGCRFINGAGSTTFAAVNDRDEVYLQFQYSF